MILLQMLPYSKFLLSSAINLGDTVIDATCGNGQDTLFLSTLVGQNGSVVSFDIQDLAIENTKLLLKKHNINNVRLIQDSHHNVDLYVNHSISGAIFNLGYLPKGDHSITTLADTTISSLTKILGLLKINGIAVVVVYHGHNNGKLERDKLLSFGASLNQHKFNVLQYLFINQQNDAPFIIAFEKIKHC
ncbi:MAG: SAM-dependent methyltransferase [Epulopiscium sp. Nuni2H_MBin003]|nr:MAG: SAM-dependent methyltransferase [Epulopiscium sp. Nuni2H_MBin003]